MALLVLSGCDDDDGMEAMGFKVTVTNNLANEYLAPIVVTDASNDGLLFTSDNYVTSAAEDQILKGAPTMVVGAIQGDGGNVAFGHGMEPKPDDATAMVLLGPGQSVDIMFEHDATSLRILAMVAPTDVPDNYVSAVVDVPMEGTGMPMPLSRFDIGYDEMTPDGMRVMDISLVGENAGTVTVERLGAAMMADDGMMDYMATYTIEVTNELASEPLAPIVATRANDEHYLFDGMYVTAAAKEQILTGSPAMVIAAIGMENAVYFRGDTPKPNDPNARVLLAPGDTAMGMFETGATALRILAMVAPKDVPDNYVSAVVNVSGLKMSGDCVMAPLTRFDIGDDEMDMEIMQVDAGMDTGMVKITRN